MSQLHLPLQHLLLGQTSYLPERASSVAEGADHIFLSLFWISAVSLALIIGVTIVFVVRYRRRPGRMDPEASPDHSTRLEIIWSVIPLLLVMAVFVASTQVYQAMVNAPPGADVQQVRVSAKKWSWQFDHPGGKKDKDVHLVLGQPTELLMISTDVIHSLYVPQWRLKQDVVPGRYTRLLVTPTKAGSFPIVCTEYCGTNHSQMNAVAVVHADQAEYQAWAAEGRGADLSLVEVGRKAFDDQGCSACHAVEKPEGQDDGIGPSLFGRWGGTEQLVGGGTAKFDENYVRESIVKPGAKVVKGYDDVMPASALEERELLGLIAYLQTLVPGRGQDDGEQGERHEQGERKEKAQ
ncbi:MAG: cytochrome c oxidase subunit II [Anaeromyxobacter sp.]|nr:cytochrome c oxidase subunit II [Anaeromyxobacter sp.]MBL0274576.1 cytochrome c oxidase subunit II [Anaeromyxobacter sp.]